MSETSSTSRHTRTSDIAGDRRATALAFVVFAAFGLAGAISGSLSVISDLRQVNVSVNPAEIWIAEITSFVIITILFFEAKYFHDKARAFGSGIFATIAIHIIGWLIFVILHVALLFLLRSAVWYLAYEIVHNLTRNPFENFVYEARKDAISYAGAVLLIYLFQRLEIDRLQREAIREDARSRQRVTLKCGGRTYYLDADGFEYASASGNYIDAVFAGREYLVRMSLQQLESMLIESGEEVVRTHRSWIVSRGGIRSVAPTGSGTATAELSNGLKIPVSRRYRANLLSLFSAEPE